MAEKLRQVEQMLELNEDESLSPEHLDSQVQKAQEQLLQLKRQQEQIEKQKRELEELSRRQEELEHGRALCSSVRGTMHKAGSSKFAQPGRVSASIWN